MNRREFLKVGVLSVPAIYAFPETFAQLAARYEPDSTRSAHDRPELRFMGRSCEEIKNNTVILPERFELDSIRTQIHFMGIKASGVLKLIPGDTALEKSLRKDLKKLALIMPKDQFLYLGQERVGKNGELHIPKKVQKFAGIRNGEVVIVGILGMIEVWDKEMWDVEYQKARQSFADITLDL